MAVLKVKRAYPRKRNSSLKLTAINAAAHPAKTRYLYYVVKPGTCGRHAFSVDMAHFQRDVARYQSARAANKGRSPTRCRK